MIVVDPSVEFAVKLAVENATLTAWAETALENSDVSPVLWLVAVAVSHSPTSKPIKAL